MPTQEHINEIASYLSKFRTGELEHRQEWFHCGTAHCLAGWKAVHDAQKAGLDVEKDRKRHRRSHQKPRDDWFELPVLDRFMEEFVGGSEWTYAAKVWGLDSHESGLLFAEHLTLDEMIHNLFLIARGYGLTVPEIPA